jgi:hypothetical protein
MHAVSSISRRDCSDYFIVTGRRSGGWENMTYSHSMLAGGLVETS